MSKYKLLPAHLQPIADAAEIVIKLKLNIGNPIIESSIDPKISWSPTFHWKTPTGVIACEVHESPFPVSVRLAFSDITASNLPIKIIVVNPSNTSRTQAEYLKELTEIKRIGCGVLTIGDDGSGNFQHHGIEVPLFIAPPKFASFPQKIRPEIQHAYDIYINGDPRHGVQEIGQLIENAIINLADQAKKKGKLTSGGFTSPSIYYAQANLIEDLMRDRVIDNAILGKCRGFVEDRNGSSHRPKSVKQSIEVNKKLKNAMAAGFLILEELPKKMKEKGFSMKI